MITVQSIPSPVRFLRLIDDRRCVTRADGLPTLFLPHLQADPETGATTLREPHRWAGWPACIEAPA